ncbi:MAG: glutamate--tRNA ligase, partial [Tenericutes bacterium HGW-Tenericutes-6]
YKAFFHDDFHIGDEGYQFLTENNSAKILDVFAKHLEQSDFEPSTIEGLIKQTGLDTETKGKALFMSLRIGTTGDMHGPSLPISLALLGKKRVLQRILQTTKRLRGDL